MGVRLRSVAGHLTGHWRCLAGSRACPFAVPDVVSRQLARRLAGTDAPVAGYGEATNPAGFVHRGDGHKSGRHVLLHVLLLPVFALRFHETIDFIGLKRNGGRTRN